MNEKQAKEVIALLTSIDKSLKLLTASQKASDDTLKKLMESVDEKPKSTDAFFSQGLVQQARSRASGAASGAIEGIE